MSSEPIPRYKLDRREGFDGTNRQSDEQLGSKVEGDSFSVAAPPLVEGSTGKPEVIAKSVKDVEVDKGWKDAGSADEVAEARKKMKEQAEVPAELPKTPTFAKPSDTPALPA